LLVVDRDDALHEVFDVAQRAFVQLHAPLDAMNGADLEQQLVTDR
jgi:hypothetical protein